MSRTAKKEGDLKKLIAFFIAAIQGIIGIVSSIALVLSNNWLLLLAIVLTFLIVSWAVSLLYRRINLLTLIVICVGLTAVSVYTIDELRSIKVKPVQIAINDPTNATKISGHRYLVKGTVSNQRADVRLLIRPLETNDYWVQETPTCNNDGSWQVNAHFGEKNIGIGDVYEVIALATEENFIVTLVTGNFFLTGKTRSIPLNTNQSNFVTVTRIN